MVREAARWGLRQTLLDDQGWEQVFAAYEHGDDLLREQLAAALVMRADAVMPAARVDLHRLAAMLDKMMSQDANPAVRAWATRAAWNWWVWNPPMRQPLNKAFVTMLQTPEPSQLAENAKRYQLQALLIVNGNRASANFDNPYRELDELFQAIVESPAPVRRHNSSTSGLRGPRPRITTPRMVLTALDSLAIPRRTLPRRSGLRSWISGSAPSKANDLAATQLAIEAAANVIHEGVQEKLLHYAVKGPEALRPIASSSLSDPRAVLLPTSPEFVGPLVERIHANAQTEEGRRQVSRNTVRQLSQARWDMPPIREPPAGVL